MNGKEVPAEPRIQELVNYELSKENPSSGLQLHLQRSTVEELAPIFIIELPTMGWQFILDSRKGITQWCVEAISDAHKQDPPMVHGFFSEKLVPFSWGMNNLLVALQRAFLCLPLQSTSLTYKGNYYIVNILLKVKGPPNGPDTKFTTHFVSGDTKLVDVFDILGGEAVDDGYTLVEWVWNKKEEKYDVFKSCRYSEARIQNMLFKDAGWIGDKEVWFLPTCQ